MWGSADFWFRLSNVIFLSSVALGFAASVGIYLTANIKEKNTDVTIAELHAAADASNAAASKANERAAELEKQTADLKSQLSWREISFDQERKLTSILSHSSGTVRIRLMVGDAEAMAFAIQLSQILERSKWKFVIAPEQFGGGVIARGIFVPMSDNPDTQLIQHAFVEAGLQFSPVNVPAPVVAYIGGGNDVPLPENVATIFIGAKLPALISEPAK